MSSDGPEFFAKARDVVRPHPGPDFHLEIFSRRPKDHWKANVMEIHYDGEAYILIDRAVLEEEGKPTRYRFRLKKAEHETVAAGVEYHPEEIREIYRQERLKDCAMWVEGLSLVWGLLDEKRQRELGRLYDYEPRRATQLSIVVTAIIGAALVVSNLMLAQARGAMGLSRGLQVMLVIVGIVVLGEAFRRWTAYTAGGLPASVVAPILRPMTDRFLRWENWP